MRIIELGVFAVNFGEKGDPERIRKIVAGFNCYHGLAVLVPHLFPEIDRWPEGQIEMALAIAVIGRNHRNIWEAINDLTTMCPPHLSPKGFPELMAVANSNVGRLWDKEHLPWVAAPALEAAWHIFEENPGFPEVQPVSDKGDLIGRPADCLCDKFGGYLVSKTA